MAAWPWYSYGSGGIVSQASSASSATTLSMSPASTAVANRPTTSRTGRVRQGRLPRRRLAEAIARPSRGLVAARPCTAPSPVSRMPATSAVLKPSASRSTSTHRCCGGRCCSAATNASAIDSLALVARLGPELDVRARRAARRGTAPASGLAQAGGLGRFDHAGLLRARVHGRASAFRQRLVAMR